MKIRSFVFLVSLTLLLALLSTGILLHTSAQSQPAVSAASAPLADPHAEPIEVEDENEDKDRPTLSPVSHTAKTPPSATERNATSVAADCYAQVASTPGITYTTVQEAVDAAIEGDTVKVAGTCAGVSMHPRDDITTTGSVTQVVYLSKTLTIRGGYTTTNWTTPDPEAYPATLDAGSQGRVFYITGDINPTIEGMNITGGDATGLGTGKGGGVYVFTATTTISGCQIYDNTAIDGGGVALHSGDATLSNNAVFSNMATNAAGGMSVSGGTVTLDDNAFYSNNAATLAGGLYLSATHAVLSGNRIYTNTVDAGDGGGLYVARTDAELINNVVIDNYLGGTFGNTGSGIHADASALQLVHTTIARNRGGELNGQGIHIVQDSTIALTNTILTEQAVGINIPTASNTVTIDAVLWSSTAVYTVFQPAGPPATIQNQHYGDPAFAADGYHLTGTSEAIDKGVDAGVTTDIDGETRPLGTAPDLGADERESTAPPPEDIYYVAPEGTDSTNSCTDSAAPCATLQHAVDVANPGGEIRLAAGTYVTTSLRAGGQQIAYITKTLTIRGGYTTTNWTTSDPISNATTLNTDWQARGLYVANVDGLTIEGLRISRGLAAIGSGGGIHLLNSTAALNGNVFADNLAQYGGALGLEGSDVTLTNNVIVDNRSTLNGHGIYVKGSSSQLLHTTLLRNGISSGSGIYVVNDGLAYSTIGLTNTILVTHSEGISVTSGNTARINGILWYNTPVTVSSGTGAVVEVQNSHEGNPALAADGYHLTGASVAAVDKGVDAGVTTDIDDHDRPYGSAPDLGADELIAITAQAGAETTLTYTDAQGNPTIIRVPAGAVTESIVLVYTPVKTFAVPSGLAFAGHAFDLEAYRNGVHLPGFAFQVPLSITIHYSDADVAGMDENGLNLYYWTGSAWENVVGTCSPSSVYDRSPGDNRLSVSVCHLSRFALFEAGSDVMITAMSIQPLTPIAGEPITITVQVRNQGGAHTTIWNDPTAAWFVVEVYAKGSDFTPAGPPTGPFDHAGGSAGDRWEYIAYPGGLAPQTNDILAFRIVLDDPDTYSFYAQADVSWEGADPPWGQSFGLIAEANEANNIYTFGQVVVESGGQEVYLPVVLKSVNSALGSSSP